MASRQELHNKLLEIMGTNNVFFQPPETLKLTYPCIVYARNPKAIKRADDRAYTIVNSYSLTLIQKSPKDDYVDDLLIAFPMIEHDQHFVTENLNHDIFTLFY